MKENRIIFPGDYDFLKISKPQMRYFQDEDEAKALKKTGSAAGVSATTTQLPPEVGMTKEGTADLGALFSQKVFPYPKPVALIKYLIQIGTVNKENALILDFFAGSGTTAQAVLIRSKSRLAGCRIYMGHDILPSQAQLSALAERQIQVHIIPDYYYRDLQEDTRWN